MDYNFIGKSKKDSLAGGQGASSGLTGDENIFRERNEERTEDA